MSSTTERKSKDDELLNLLEDLNVNLGAVEPSTIKAWYDTDDQDTLNLLNFMCSSLSKQNVLSPQELAEYHEIENPLRGTELEEAVKELDKRKPGIFDYNKNLELLKIAEKELEELEREEKHLNYHLKVKQGIKETLRNTEHSKQQELVKLDIELEETEQKCEQVAAIRDANNQKLYKKLSHQLDLLNNFQCGEKYFFNKNDHQHMEDGTDFETTLNEFIAKHLESLSNSFNTQINSTREETDQELLEKRIHLSSKKLYSLEVEKQSLLKSISKIEQIFNGKTPQSKLPVKHLPDPDELKAKQILELNKNNLAFFHKILSYLTGVFSSKMIYLLFLLHEKRTIVDCDEFLRTISTYVSNLNKTSYQNEVMRISTENWSSGDERKKDVVSNIVTFYEEETWERAFVKHSDVLRRLNQYRNQHFKFGYKELIDVVNYSREEKALTEFLYSGPTKQIVVIPTSIVKSIQSVREYLVKQEATIKYLLHVISSSVKNLTSDELLKKSRLLWIYFLTDEANFQEALVELQRISKEKAIKSISY